MPSIYATYRKWRGNPIARRDSETLGAGDLLAPETREVLDAVQAVYGQIPAWKLSDLTHGEPPWSRTQRGGVIPHEVLRGFFLAVVNAGKAGESVSGEPVWPTNTLRYQRRKEIMGLAPSREKLRTIAARVPSPDPWASDNED